VAWNGTGLRRGSCVLVDWPAGVEDEDHQPPDDDPSIFFRYVKFPLSATSGVESERRRQHQTNRFLVALMSRSGIVRYVPTPQLSGNLSTSQQGEVGRASRCDRISGWADRDADAPVRGSGGNSAPTACAASDRGRGGCPEARHLRGLKLRTNLCRPPYEAAYFFHEALCVAG
jgi:hypothetical protein